MTQLISRTLMLKRFLVLLALLDFASIFSLAQDGGGPHIRVAIDLVQLNVAVTDDKGRYITGLRPEDFVVTEDRIPEHIAAFGEGNESVRTLLNVAPPGSKLPPAEGAPDTGGRVTASELSSLVGGANVFVLFDTSNYMYRGFVFAQDAIADFVRSLEGADRVAFYSYSRDLSRGSLLSADRSQVLHGVRTTVAGDDAALYN